MSYQAANLRTISGWVGRLLRLDLTVFEEIRSDPSATLGAIIVVAVASVLAGIGSWLWAVQTRGVDGAEVFYKSLVVGSILQTLAWFIWVYFVFQVLARGYGARTDIFELIRTMGFAFAPVGLSILIAVPNFTVPFGVISLTGAVLLIQRRTAAGPGGELRRFPLLRDSDGHSRQYLGGQSEHRRHLPGPVLLRPQLLAAPRPSVSPANLL
jgi:hypothetical protein